MLEDLEVLNGTMGLLFDKYVNVYTVVVDENEETLDISYKLKGNESVAISNNVLDEDINNVYVDVFDGENIERYTLVVTKKKMEVAVFKENEAQMLEVEAPNDYHLEKMMVTLGLALVLIIVFYFLFLKKKCVKKCK
mgnify:FL=1